MIIFKKVRYRNLLSSGNKFTEIQLDSHNTTLILGENGAGKSTLSAVIMGKPGYKVLAGSVTLDGVDMLALPTWERAIAGLHLVMQYPTEVPGVHADQVMAEALTARHRGTEGMAARITQEALRINMDPELVTRALNVDLSGGEKKRNETMQLGVLEPKFAILDELDSGLDIDALRIVAKGIREVRVDRPTMGVVLITHYQRLLDELAPDHVHVMVDGRIVASGGMEIAEKLEVSGYESFRP